MKSNVQAEFESRYIPEPNSGCWLWLGSLDAAGYGRMSVTKKGIRKLVSAHRLSYLLTTGKSYPELDHTCKLRCCVNPEHLEPVTHHENIMRGTSPSALHAKQTHCVNGHEFTPENTYTWCGPKGNMRQCRACGRRNSLKYWGSKK